MTTHLFLSPHLDDAVLSAGGAIDALVRARQRVVVASFCTGDPPDGVEPTPLARELHARWGDSPAPYAARRREDVEACAALGAETRHVGLLDAIYRRRGGEYRTRGELFGPIPAWDSAFHVEIAAQVETLVRDLAPTAMYVPLAVGRNVDHQHVLAAVGRAGGAELFLYEDQPYSAGIYGAHSADPVADARAACGLRLVPETRAIDLGVKIAAVRRYQSQLEELFGPDLAGLEALSAYARALSGERLWRVR
jgi:LmbE family N-acetylglucosaminyl deacetylase